MSKKKNKKKPDREITSVDYKKSWIFVLIIIIWGVWSFAYEKIFGTIEINIHKPYYFISYKSDVMDVLMIVFLAVIIISLGTYLFEKTKTPKNKYIIRSFSIVLIMLIGMIIFNCNVWSFNKDTFSYNTISQKDKIVYSYDDIDFAEVEIYSTSFKRSISYYIDYTLHMNDGKKIKFDAYNAYYTNEDKIIEFDKSIADKRSVVEDDYDHNLYDNEKLNEYYSSIYNYK